MKKCKIDRYDPKTGQDAKMLLLGVLNFGDLSPSGRSELNLSDTGASGEVSFKVLVAGANRVTFVWNYVVVPGMLELTFALWKSSQN